MTIRDLQLKRPSFYYLTDHTVKVRVQHVLGTQIEMGKITDTKQFPRNTRNKKAYIERGVFTISACDLEDMHNEIRRRDALDFLEEQDDEEYDEDSGDNSDDESNC